MAIVDGRTMDDPTEARARVIGIFLILALIGPLCVWAFMRQNFGSLTEGDAFDYAQLARNMYEGRGYITRVIRPATLAWNGDIFAQPEALRAPAYPIALAIAFGIMQGTSDRAVVLTSALFFLLTVPLLWILTRRLFGFGPAILAVLLFVTSAAMLRYATNGLPTTMLMFLTTLLFVLLTNKSRSAAPPARPFLRYGLAGAVGGLCYLTDYLWLFALPAWLLYVYFAEPERRLPRLAVFTGGFLLVAAPWMVRNALVTGNPLLGLLLVQVPMETRIYPATSLFRMVDGLGSVEIGFRLLGAVAQKAFIGLKSFYEQFPALLGLWLTPLAGAGLFLTFRHPQVARLRWLLVGMAASLLLGLCLVSFNIAPFAALVPLMLALACGALFTLLRQAGWPAWRRGLCYAGVMVAAAFPLFFNLTLGSVKLRNPVEQVLEARRTQWPKEAVVVSDVPWAVAWYTGRPSIWIPRSEQLDLTKLDEDPEIKRLFERVPQADRIYLSPLVLQYPAGDPVVAWALMYRQQTHPEMLRNERGIRFPNGPLAGFQTKDAGPFWAEFAREGSAAGAQPGSKSRPGSAPRRDG